MFKDWITLDGTLETVEEINKAYAEATGDTENLFEADDEGWRAWVEYRDGKTIILQDGV